MELSDRSKKIGLFVGGSIIGLIFFFVLRKLTWNFFLSDSRYSIDQVTTTFTNPFLYIYIIFALYEILLYFLVTGTRNKLILITLIVLIIFVISGIILVRYNINLEMNQCTGCGSAFVETIGQQILDDLRTGNKKVSIPYTKLNLEPSEESVQAIGIKNLEESPIIDLCYDY